MSDREQGPSGPRSEPATGLHHVNGKDSTLHGQEDETQIRMGQPPSPAVPGTFVPSPGDRIGDGDRFELHEKLGAGGMGIVFRASDVQLRRPIAIKFIHPGSGSSWGQLVEQLKLEAQATAKLNHENIVGLFDLGTWQGTPFLVMELMQGQSLRELMGRERLTARRATGILIDVARGLAHAHGNGVIHRDLKPSNVFILQDGRAKILDFGLARSFGERRLLLTAGSSGLSEDDTSLSGTPAYMSPEQWRRELQDGRTDIWAMGVLFYEMLVGAVPFNVGELRRFLQPTLPRLEVPSVRARRADLPEQVDRIVARALQTAPAERYQSIGEMLSALLALDQQLRAQERSGARPRAEAERRLVTLLCCTLSRPRTEEEDPEDTGEVLRAFHQLCAEQVEPSGGTIVTSVSGQLLACFGYPTAEEDDAARAVRAGLAIAQAARTAEPQLAIRLGIHTGLVIAQSQRGIPALQGEAPGVATWISAQTPPNTVVMSERTAQLVPGLFDAVRLEGLAPPPGAAGRELTAYEVRAEQGMASRFGQVTLHELTPLVGREQELSRLLALWEEAKQGRGQFVMLSGDPGLGKSRIVHELLHRVGDSVLHLLAQCWPQLRHTPFHPVIDIEYRALKIRKSDPPEEKLAKLERWLEPLGSLPENVPLWASLMSVPLRPPYEPLGLTPEQLKGRTLETLSARLLKAAEQEPVVVVVEDVHWVDHSTLELLNLLFAQLPTARILMLVTFRPEFRPPWPEAPHRHLLELDRLPSELAASMVMQTASSLPPEVVAQLVSRADGIPLFLEQLARAVLEAGSPRALDIPDTLHDLLLARLDRLTGEAKEVAQLGAIIGRDFNLRLLRKLWTHDEVALQDALARLVEAGLVTAVGAPEDGRYSFKHALIQEAAQHSILKKRRQQHHQQIARLFVEEQPDIVEARPELLAHHHAEAGNVDEAILYLEKAGQRAAQRSAQVDAINHLTRALHLLQAKPEMPERNRKEVALRLALGAPLMAVKGYAHPDVEKVYGRARELCRQAGEDAQLIPALQGLYQFYMVSGALPTSRELAEQLLALARAQNNSASLLLAHRALATTAILQGELTACRENTEKGLALYDKHEHRALIHRVGHDAGVTHGLYAAWGLWLLGQPDDALARAHAAVALAHELGHLVSLAWALNYLAMIHNYRGEHALAHSRAEEAIGISREHKFALWLAWGTMQRGWARAGLGVMDGGIEELRQGIQGWMRTGARAGMTFFPITQAEFCWRAGRYSEAMTLLDEAARVVQQNDEHFYEAELLRLRGELTLALDPSRTEAARECFRRGLEIARQQSAKSWELRLAMSLARLAAREGGAEEGRRTLAEVYRRFDQGLDTGDLVRARELLGSA